AAGLNGELRSAHWFAAQRAGEAGWEAGQTASGWAAFHVAQAAERATAVDWQRLYPAPRTARLWTATAALSIAALALSIGLAPAHFTTLTGLAVRGGERRAADATGVIATRKATALSRNWPACSPA